MPVPDQSQYADNYFYSLKKYSVYFLIYSSYIITFLFTLGGAVFSIPAVCSLFGIGVTGQLIIGVLCSISAFWGTVVIQGVALRDFFLNITGFKEEIPTAKSSFETHYINGEIVPAAVLTGISQENAINPECISTQMLEQDSVSNLIMRIVVFIMLFSNAVYFIAGSYFGMLALMSLVGINSGFLAAIGAFVLSVINYFPTFALNGMGLYDSAMGNNKLCFDVAIQQTYLEPRRLDLTKHDFSQYGSIKQTDTQQLGSILKTSSLENTCSAY